MTDAAKAKTQIHHGRAQKGSARQETGASFRCVGCGALSNSPEQNFRCVACGDLLEIFYPTWTSTDGRAHAPDPNALKQTWRQRKISRDPADESGVWRFRELLPPADNKTIISLREGNTPIYELARCARSAGMKQLFGKHQGMNPTGSFKDTGMTVAISVAAQNGFRWVACASTGNTSASMAAYAARGGLRSR